ncbi:MAG: SDR family NAD(P)-dependent oxidoreductase [Clostridia bacterium]|nr:SDR family NAD(P)-dependent oxidoreductase [Clostridia bacterium]
MKTILVTGASGGMGSAICRLLAERGFRVYALDVKPLNMAGVASFVCDLRTEDGAAAALSWFQAQEARLDAIVHAAGVYDLDSLVEMDDERFRRIFEVNVFAACHVNRLFTPMMASGGRIVFITSELAPLNPPMPFTGVYAVTKKTLEAVAGSLRTEMALRDIAVSIVRPGAVKTPLLGDSTRALTRFCERTRYYGVNAGRFRRVVDSVEARSVPPERVAEKVHRALTAKHPKRVYNLNRNPLLLLLNALPAGLQEWVLVKILK